MARENPYRENGWWYWLDEDGAQSRPHKTQRAALCELLAYIEWLDHGPTLWQRVWWPVRRWFMAIRCHVKGHLWVPLITVHTCARCGKQENLPLWHGIDRTPK